MNVEDLIANNHVMIFSKSFCPFCRKVESLFKQLKVTYKIVELDLLGDERELQTALIEKTGQKTVPNVFINGIHAGGCDNIHDLHANGKLAAMLMGTYVQYDYDLLVIGGGSGGLAASKEAAALGKKVAVCDFVMPSPLGTTWGLGGTCVNVGCIPKKLMHKASLIGEDMHDGQFFGWDLPDKVNNNWQKLMTEVQNHIKSLNFGYRSSLRKKSVTYINAYAEICTTSDAHKIKLKDKKGNLSEVTAEHVIVAVGGRPRYPDIPGAREYGITSDDLFSLPYCPGKTLIVGASYIALECAGFLQGLGLKVTVMVRSILLRGFDQQMAEMIGNNMAAHSVNFIKECIPTRVAKVVDGNPSTLEVIGVLKNGEVIKGHYNTVIFAVGREACTKNIGLEAVGVHINPKNSKVVCDEGEKSSVDHIFAIGDVVDGKPELTPIAIEAGRNLAHRLYGKRKILTDYTNVPTTVFTPLEYGCVGISEEDAISKYGENNIEVYHSHFQPLEFTLSDRDSFVSYGKLICLKSDQERVIGFHILCPNAGEITQGFALGIKLGAKKTDFDSLIGIHPTCAEVFTSMNVTKSSGATLEKSSC